MTQAPAPPTRPDSPGRTGPHAPGPRGPGGPRRRAWLVVVPLLLALVVAAAVGARLLYAALPHRATAAATGSCWDGSAPTGAGGAHCHRPTGTAGLAWVFPSFSADDPDCAQRPDPSGSAVPLVWRCRVAAGSDHAVVTYVQRTSLARARAALEEAFPGVQPQRVRGGQRLTWTTGRVAGADGRYGFGEAYTRVPFTVTVSAPTAAARDAAADALQFRLSRYLTTRP